MNGEQDQVPPTGWQFRPDGNMQAATPDAAVTAPVANQSPVPAPQPAPPDQTQPAPLAAAVSSPVPQPEAVAAPGTAPAAPDTTQAASHPQAAPHPNVMEWTATDGASAKPAGWFGMLVVTTLLVTVAIYFITRDFLTTGGVAAAALIFGYYSTREPHGVSYRINSSGIAIGRKQYDFSQFRSFSLDRDGRVRGVVLMPLKRFMPALTLSCPPELESQVATLLADHLPLEDFRRDPLDHVIDKLRF